MAQQFKTHNLLYCMVVLKVFKKDTGFILHNNLMEYISFAMAVVSRDCSIYTDRAILLFSRLIAVYFPQLNRPLGSTGKLFILT